MDKLFNSICVSKIHAKHCLNTYAYFCLTKTAFWIFTSFKETGKLGSYNLMQASKLFQAEKSHSTVMQRPKDRATLKAFYLYQTGRH